MILFRVTSWAALSSCTHISTYVHKHNLTKCCKIRYMTRLLTPVNENVMNYTLLHKSTNCLHEYKCASRKAGCQIWPILGMEFRTAVTALLKEVVLLSLQKQIYCNNFVNIVKLFKYAIKDLLACSNYSATLRMITYPALPVPALTSDLLVVNCVQLPRSHHFYKH